METIRECGMENGSMVHLYYSVRKDKGSKMQVKIAVV